MPATEPVSQPSPPSSPSSTSLRPAEWRGFQGLMPHRIHDILVVSSLYDSFILAEDGQLYERILAESEELNLRNVPGITRVSSGAEALALLAAQPRFNLVVTSLHVGDMGALALARGIRKVCGKGTAVTLLAYDARELADFVARHDARELDGIFLWQGDVRILLAIVKFVEDRWNVAYDTEEAGVQAILLVEDSVRYYSSFLPVIYSEIWRHSHGLIPDGINLSQKLLRLRARPKVLLCRTWEEAWDAFTRYHEHVLGVISDVEFPREGALEPLAGVELARRIKADAPDVPVMLQSSRPENEALAKEAGASFALKESPFLLQELRDFMARNFGFGDFVFRLPDGTEVGRASDLKSLEEMLWTVPAESVGYHGERNHFSNWLKARTEFDLAHSLRAQEGARLPDARRPPPGPDPLDPGVPAPSRAAARRRLRPRHLRRERPLLPPRRRLARGQGARPRLREPPPRRRGSRRAVPGRPRLRPLLRRRRDERLRPVPRRERPARVRHRVCGRRGARAALPRRGAARGDR